MPMRPTLTVENRQSPRKAVNWRARLLRTDGTVVECRAIDSSAGGVGLVSQAPMRVDERVQVALQVPDEQTSQMRVVVHDGLVVASVLTSAGYRVGVRLVDPLQELLDEIPPKG